MLRKALSPLLLSALRQQAAHTLTTLSALRQQAAHSLTTLQKEIVRRDEELAVLKAEAARWQVIAQQKHTAVPLATQDLSSATPRLQWDTVLHELPETFTLREVAQKTAKPMSQVYMGIRRWVTKKKIVKVAEGYRKVTS